GFGASLTDSSAFLLSRLSPAKRDAALRGLFDTRAGGIGFSVVRVPMGASDFTHRGNYTYNDLPAGETDHEQKWFSIQPDEAYILPLLRRIRQINPALTVMASPWSAPAWMKTSKKMNGGWLDWPAYAAYARYFVRFIEAYKKAGVRVDYVTLQNEPRLERDSYPTMRMEPGDQSRFVREHLGPAFRKAGITTKILVWDHNWDVPEFPMEVLKDAVARRDIAGVAWHAYAGKPEAQESVRRAYPAMETHFTESSGGAFAPDFGGNVRWDVANLVVGATKYGASTVLKWNLALDPKHGPQNGGCTDCRGVITINPATGAITRNEEFYALGHASRWVRPGAVRLETADTSDFPGAGFRNHDGSLVFVGANGDTAKARTLRLQCGKRPPVTVNVPAGAAVTVVYAAV
ncbi:MAG: glycoside hydrolase, partial [Fibrella sp.]|nr:glycoside hydrolase [Armatimonadota bacterium]